MAKTKGAVKDLWLPGVWKERGKLTGGAQKFLKNCSKKPVNLIN